MNYEKLNNIQIDIDYVNTISKLCYLKSLNKIENANRKDKKF